MRIDQPTPLYHPPHNHQAPRCKLFLRDTPVLLPAKSHRLPRKGPSTHGPIVTYRGTKA